jgi:type I restriction enzyme S subunit
MCLVVQPSEDTTFESSIIRARPNPDWADSRFLYYLFRSSQGSALISSIATRTAVSGIRGSELALLKVPKPPLSIQRKIAAILSAYDDLIENNTRRIQILEEMAAAMYREWFVEFRFPGYEGVEMVESELGLIPQGWMVKKVKEIVKRLRGGQTYQQANVKDTGEVIVIDQSRADLLGFHDNEPDHNASPADPIIIFGDHTCKIQLMITPFSLGPNVVPFIAKDEMPISYLFFGVSNLVETREYKRHWTELNNKEIAIGDSETRKRFSDFVTPIFEQIEILRQKNQNLRQTRDLLLPKLISGEFDVSKLNLDID